VIAIPDFFVIYFNEANQEYQAVNGPNVNKTFTALDGTDANGEACLQTDLNGKYVAFNVTGPNKAHFQTFFEPANTNLVFTADAAGVAGNSIRIRYLVAGNNTALSVVVASNDITVNLATNGSGVPTSTGATVLAAINASGPATALIDVAHEAGSDGSGVIPEGFTYRNLEYGSSGAAIATIVEQVESTSSTPTTF
jgi:hypothetical protein